MVLWQQACLLRVGEKGDDRFRNKRKSTGEEETVTIWHDGDEAIMGVIEDTVNKKIADENVSIKV